MASENSTQYVRGIAHWAKVLGKPRYNRFNDENEWTIDVSVDKDGLKLFKALGIVDRLRDPKEGEDRDRFITFRQREFKKDGERNDPIKIVDAAGEPWNQNTLIGNGSVVDVKFRVKDYGRGKKKGVYIQAVRVLSLVPYETQEFAPLSSDDEYFANTADEESTATPDFEKDFGLEDTPDDDLDDDIAID